MGFNACFLFLSSVWFFFYFIYLFMKDTQREAETQAKEEADTLQGAQHGTQSPDPGIMT